MRKNPQPAREKAFVHAEDLAALLKAARDFHPRNEYYIKISWAAARRMSDVRGLRVEHVDFAARPRASYGTYKFYNQKLKRWVAHPMTRLLSETLAEWFVVYAELLGRKLEPDDFVVPAMRAAGTVVEGMRRTMKIRPKDPLPYTSALEIFTNAAKACGQYEPGKGTHALRRGGAEDLFRRFENAGVKNPIRRVMTHLDHKDEGVTRRYLDQKEDVAAFGEAIEELEAANDASTPASDPVVSTSFAERLARRQRGA